MPCTTTSGLSGPAPDTKANCASWMLWSPREARKRAHETRWYHSTAAPGWRIVAVCFGHPKRRNYEFATHTGIAVRQFSFLPYLGDHTRRVKQPRHNVLRQWIL